MPMSNSNSYCNDFFESEMVLTTVKHALAAQSTL